MGGSLRHDNGPKGTGRWYIDVYWDGRHWKIWEDPNTGQKFFREKEARKILGAIQREVDLGMFNPKHWKPDSPMIIREYYPGWLAGASISKKTSRDYSGYFVNHIVPEIGGMDIRHVRHKHLCQLYQTLRRKLSDKGAYNVMGGLKAMLKWAWRSEDIPSVPPFPKLGFQLPEIHYLTMEQQTAILGHIPEQHRPIFEIGMEFGLRTQEVRAVMKDCVQDGKLCIKRSFADNNLQEHTKTSEIRYFDITSYAQKVIDSIPQTLSQFVFTRGDGMPYTNKNMNVIWAAACEAAGIKIKLQAAFRHSLGCQLLDQGETMDLVQDTLGHTTPNMSRRYAKRQVARVTDALERRRARVIDFPERSRNGEK